MNIIIDLPEQTVLELAQNHDDVETAIREAIAVYQDVDRPPEVMAAIRDDHPLLTDENMSTVRS